MIEETTIQTAVSGMGKLNRAQQDAMSKIIHELRRLQKRVTQDDVELERLYRENERMASPSYWT